MCVPLKSLIGLNYLQNIILRQFELIHEKLENLEEIDFFECFKSLDSQNL